ncbi:hypothetical protein S83_005955 [Arachis hypogaea]
MEGQNNKMIRNNNSLLLQLFSFLLLLFPQIIKSQEKSFLANLLVNLFSLLMNAQILNLNRFTYHWWGKIT